MKIILSVEALTPQLTGIGRYTWQLAAGLPRVMPQGSIRFHHQQRWVQNPALLLCDPPDDAFIVPKSRIPWGFRRIHKRLNRPNWRRDCRDSVFHGPNFFVPDYAERAVVTIHDLSVFKYPETHPKERIDQFNRDFPRSIAKASQIITDSEATRLEVVSFTGIPESRVTTVHLAANHVYRPREADELVSDLAAFGLLPGMYTACVSTLEPRKNIANLISAYRRLPNGLRNRIPLVLAGGNGWLSDSLQCEIESASAEGWLKYLGFVPEAALPAIYAGARVFAYPSVYEGFGLPVLEAMASGVPVVASNRTSLPEVTQGNALHVDPDDVVGLSEALVRAMEDEEWRRHVVSRGLVTASKYSWERCIQETIAVYRRLS